MRKTSETPKTVRRERKKPLERSITTRASIPIATSVKHKNYKPFTSDHISKPTTHSHNTSIQPSLNDAEALANSGKFSEAENICLQHLNTDKQNSRAYYLLGMVQLTVGNPQKAVDYLKKVIYLQPSNVDALMFLSTLTAEQGDPELANRYLQRAQRAKQRLKTTVVH